MTDLDRSKAERPKVSESPKSLNISSSLGAAKKMDRITLVTNTLSVFVLLLTLASVPAAIHPLGDTDEDGDGLLLRDELNDRRKVRNSDEGIDDFFDHQDPDDDGDGVPTQMELDDEGRPKNSDNDEFFDHLDSDDDGDKVLTRDEIGEFAISRNVSDLLSNGGEGPDYLNEHWPPPKNAPPDAVTHQQRAKTAAAGLDKLFADLAKLQTSVAHGTQGVDEYVVETLTAIIEDHFSK